MESEPQATPVVRGGPNSGAMVAMTGEPITMGRRSDNDIVVDETTVSRRHSLIMETPDGYVVRDLNTTNGTFVNQNWLDQSERILHHGDQIRLGGSEVTIMFRQEGPRTMTMTTGTPPPSKQPAAPIPDLSMSTPVQPPAPAVILEAVDAALLSALGSKKGPWSAASSFSESSGPTKSMTPARPSCRMPPWQGSGHSWIRTPTTQSAS